MILLLGPLRGPSKIYVTLKWTLSDSTRRGDDGVGTPKKKLLSLPIAQYRSGILTAPKILVPRSTRLVNPDLLQIVALHPLVSKFTTALTPSSVPSLNCSRVPKPLPSNVHTCIAFPL